MDIQMANEKDSNSQLSTMDIQMANEKDSNSQNKTEEKSWIQQMKDIYKTLDKENEKKVNIFGSPGFGKTRMANRVCERAIRDKLFDLNLWVFMCIEYTTESLSLSIARQLSLLPTTEEWEADDDSRVQKDDDDSRVQKDDDEADNTKKIVEKIKEKLRGKRVLLILDDALDGKDQNETKFWSVWDEIFPSDLYARPKSVFISRLKKDDKDIPEENVINVNAFPSVDDSYSLLIEKLDSRLKFSEEIQTLGKDFIQIINENSPGKVTMLAKAFNYFGLEASGVSLLRKELEEFAVPKKRKELEEASKNYNVSKLLCMKDDLLPIGVLKDLCWRGHHYFRDCGSVHYSELITYWILERYLGSGTMTNLYKKGHDILMELMDCGVLKVQEGGYVFMDNSLINVDDLYQRVDQTASLGLATLFTSDAECFGRITHEDGMLKTPRTRKKGSSQKSGQSSSQEGGQNLSTLLLDGTHFTEQVMLDFLEPEKKLQVLALFNPTIKSLPKSLSMMKGLRVLVLRGCEFLQDVKLPLPLETLNVLEISGARSMKSLRSSFFKNMSNLKSLHLSGLQITVLPAAIYNLHKLQWLIIKDCPRLKKLENISKLDNLMVVDLSGNRALDTVDKNFLKFTKLQSLNLSETLVSTTPLLKNIGELTHLLCRGCSTLDRLRGLTRLTNLQTIDLSGSKEFEEFHDSSLESLCSLRNLDLSGTSIDRLPSNISIPSYLYLKSCLKLKSLSCFESLKNLVELDLSGSTNLSEIEDKFFDQMTLLRILNLSETKVVCLPSLFNLSDLRKLFLSCCKSLTLLPSLESTTKLEILDVSKCSVLQTIENLSFDSMTCLQKLDFSETKIKSFPSLSNKCNLRHLLLKNCTNLQDLKLDVSFSNLEELNLSGITSFERAEFVKDISTLRILDLSYTSLKQLPSMSKLSNLTHLSLAGCPFTETDLDLHPLNKLEVLDLSRTSIKQLPNLMKSNNLQKLLLKDCSMVEIFPDVKLNDYPKIPDDIPRFSHLHYLEFPNIEIDSSTEHQWNICLLSENDEPPVFLNGIQFLQMLKKDHLPLGPIHLCAVPVKVEGETGDRYLQRHELTFGDVYLQTSGFFQYKGNKLLQIRGFNHFPIGIENIIREVNLVFLIDYKLKGLPSGFDTSMFSNLKGCWIERCDEMVTIFHEKEGNDNPDFDISLENLGICNNLRLEKIYDGKQQFGRFDSLKSLYLDNCPNITTVFPSSWLPKNLEALQIKNCDKIVSLFETGGEVPKLETLFLWELPELKDICVSISSLQTLKICECPKLKQIEDIFEIPKGLKTLWICGATRLKSLHSENDEIRDLETLKLESCPRLEYILSKCSPLEKVKIMEIKSCKKIQTLLQDPNKTLPIIELETLVLEDLPMLKRIGFRYFSNSLLNATIKECPNLNETIDD